MLLCRAVINFIYDPIKNPCAKPLSHHLIVKTLPPLPCDNKGCANAHFVMLFYNLVVPTAVKTARSLLCLKKTSVPFKSCMKNSQ